MTQYRYNSPDLVKDIDLTEREEFLLKRSKRFCMYPWIAWRMARVKREPMRWRAAGESVKTQKSGP